METSFDLDVNNYSINDLINFFKLKDNFDTNDIEKRVGELTNEIFSFDSSRYEEIQFVDISSIGFL
jgi:hypothetical protein